MMRITDARERRVSLVLQLNDIVTGEIIIGGKDIQVASCDELLAPVVKPDGYFVFTDRCPDKVSVRSKTYRDAVIRADGHTGGVLRFALLPRLLSGRTIAVPEDSHIGFSGHGYALSAPLSEASTEILLRKEDFRDVTDLFHVLVTPDGATEAIYLERNLGVGRYSLRAPPGCAYQVRGTRVVAMHRTAGGQIPIPPEVETAYIMSGDIVTTKSLEGL